MKSLFSALSPNIEKDDLLLTKKVLKRSVDEDINHVQILTGLFNEYLGGKSFAFQSGRMAFWAILRSFSWPAGSEIIVPGFTCAAAINPIIWSELKPVFVDINESLNIDLKKIESKISGKTKGILVQHTFGLPVDMIKIKELAEKYNLKIIEDCAHSLGSNFRGKLLGSWGDAAFFSLGRDKIISSVFGGLAFTNNSLLADRLANLMQEASYPSNKWIKQQLRHPLLTAKWIMPYYNKKELGRKILLFSQKIGLLSKAMTREEKMGKMRSDELIQMPQSLAILAINQFSKLNYHQQHRIKIANFYREKLKNLPILLPREDTERTYLKFNIIFSDKKTADDMLKYFRSQNIYLYDGWKDSPIVPSDVDLSAMQYQKGICSVAEDLSGKLVNLPTHINISMEDASRIVETIKSFLNTL